MDYIYDVEKLGYNPARAESIERYAQGLIGLTIGEAVGEYAVEAKRNKGNLGQLIEKGYFGYENNNESLPDFYEAGVELKLTPFKKNKNGSYSAKERLIITMIDYMKVIYEDDLYTSHLWTKASKILLVEYLYKKDIKDTLDYKIKYATLFSPQREDLPTIEADYHIIVSKVQAGKAHELSEGDTYYLGAATKAQSAADRRQQPNSPEPAKPRAFSFKTTYMTYILNHYVMRKKPKEERIIQERTDKDLASYIIDRISRYEGRPVSLLCDIFGMPQPTSKNFKSLAASLTYRMLGVTSNRAEELLKADIVVKTIRIEKGKDKIDENMSFPTIKFKELAEETWEESKFARYLHEKKFLFAVYEKESKKKKKGDEKQEPEEMILRGCQFWNMPYEDIEKHVSEVWHKMQEVVISGDFRHYDKKGSVHYHFPKKKDSPVCHVRPHGNDNKDVDEMPNGIMCPKQSFWLNKEYVYSQLEERLK